MATEPIPPARRLAYAAPQRRRTAIFAFALGVALAAAEILLFDWSPREMAPGALVGTCVWAAVYCWSAADLVPGGAPLEAPPGIAVDPGGVAHPLRLTLIVAACIPFAWLANRFDVGGVFVPGQFWGFAAGALIAVVRISRWERANGRRVVFDPEASKQRPYAGPPL